MIVFRIGRTYYPEVFPEESKYVFNKNKMPEYITDDVEISLMRTIPMKKTLIKKAMIKKIMV